MFFLFNVIGWEMKTDLFASESEASCIRNVDNIYFIFGVF